MESYYRSQHLADSPKIAESSPELGSTGNLEDYMTRLVNAFNPGAGAGSSCGGQTA